MCGHEIDDIVVSPDKLTTAYVYTQDCGATTDFVRKVSLVESGRALEADERFSEEGSVIYFNEGNDPALLKWTSRNDLVVTATLEGQFFNTRTKWNHVNIQFFPTPAASAEISDITTAPLKLNLDAIDG